MSSAVRISIVIGLVWLAISLAQRATAQPPASEAQVQLPLSAYDHMVERARAPEQPPQPAPARYALGNASAEVEVDDSGQKLSAHVSVSLKVRVLESGWVAVPLLDNGTALRSATIDGHDVELHATANGLAFSTDHAGSFAVELEYDVDAQARQHGSAFAIPLPQAPSTRLHASLPGSDLDVAVIPAASVSTQQEADATVVDATIPSARGFQLSWRVPGAQGYDLSRAHYHGVLERDAMRFTGEFELELLDGERATVPLLPNDVTISELTVDGKPSPIAIEDDTFAARVRGRGAHRLKLAFEVPVAHDAGPPHVGLQIPLVPVSELEITLPGDKEITLEPAAHVQAQRRSGMTVSHAFLPFTEQVQVSWAEAVPEAVNEELLANANIYHLVHAEEGVLYVHALVVYEVTSGRTNVLLLDVPANVQVSDIHAAGSGIKQAIKARGEVRGPLQRYQVFLDRELQGELRFDVFYERKLALANGSNEALAIPMLKAAGVSRQRGMVALLASKELTLNPDASSEQNVTRVGDNQLPAFVREAADKTVTHTYKYLEDEPQLMVRPAPPERKQGKFDAQVDTLISLGDVTMRGAATVEINVKSGSLEALALRLPAGVNLLGLTAPSLRTHALREHTPTSEQFLDVQFTQQMEGQFRIELSYERITSENEAKLAVPTLNVVGAEVEQGRIAVEALSAVEVSETAHDHLSPLDPNELPQQLVLKTTNPILRAYKYVQVEPPYALALKVTRHKEVEVQQAAIDQARYQTLYTRDGLAVTTATFQVRNSREQFLKVQLPKASKVWSAFVAGRAEKPAMEVRNDNAPTVLIKIINSTEGFPVELVYETAVEQIGALGRIRGQLPTPDMVVTHSLWEVFLPEDLSYGEPDSNMEQGTRGKRVDAEAIKTALASSQQAAGLAPLRIDVPTSGVQFSFSKIYANRSAEPASFSLPFNSRGGAWLARVLALVGTLLFWIGLLWSLQGASRRRVALGFTLGGTVLVLIALSSFGVGIAWPLLWSLLLLTAGASKWAFDRRPRSTTR